ncbi:hypothetical protein LSAT2_026748 [Lamellibrachia satsuma]|nr:hypothetical protein LSAT2_026748 [Lamellibrachia satsuma]
MQIGICVYNVMVMSVVSVLIYRFLPLQKMDVSFGVISISVFVCAVTTLLLVFVPKMQLVATGSHRVNNCAVLPFASSMIQMKRTAAGGISNPVEDCPGPNTTVATIASYLKVRYSENTIERCLISRFMNVTHGVPMFLGLFSY